MSPAQRSLKLLRAEGFLCAVVERWNSHVGIRQDLFNFADIIAVGNGKNILIQTTVASALANREIKVRENLNAKLWLSIPNNHIEVHGWAKKKIKRGGTAFKYRVIRREVVL